MFLALTKNYLKNMQFFFFFKLSVKSEYFLSLGLEEFFSCLQGLQISSARV